MSEHSDLIARLRARWRAGKWTDTAVSDPLRIEAADAIQALEQELEHAHNALVMSDEAASEVSAALLARAESAEASVARLTEALEPFARVLVYSFEDAPETILVSYDGQQLAALPLDSEQGTAALKLEQELAAARTALASTSGGGNG